MIYTDHKNLIYFASTKQVNRRQAKWAELLSNYNFELIYRSGSTNTKADLLSQRVEFASTLTKSLNAKPLDIAPHETISSFKEHPSLAVTMFSEPPSPKPLFLI